jgi:hypothetical protein
VRSRNAATVARHFIEHVGFPIIAKPDVGVGAARTYRIEDDGDLDAFLGDRPPIDYILEEELTGQLLSFDGLVDRAGRIVFSSSLVYGVPVLDAVRGADMFYWIDREIAPDLAELGARIVDAFGVRSRPFHFEFFRQPSGDLAALEVNMRQPGGLTVDMWDWANDIDFYRAWADVLVHGTADITTRRPYFCFWSGRKTGKTYLLSHDEVVERFRDRSSTTSASMTSSRRPSATSATSSATRRWSHCSPPIARSARSPSAGDERRGASLAQRRARS